jgi:hypothetical protein
MLEQIWSWIQAHEGLTAALAGGSVLMFVGSLLALPWLVARLPVDYFVDPRRHASRLRRFHPVLNLTLLLFKNLLGWVLLLAGVAMLVLPGQGILTILMGVVLSDFPGKFTLERRLACTPAVFRAINWLRERAGRGPVLPPRHPDGSPCAGVASD